MDLRTKKIIIWVSSVCAALLVLFVLLVVSGVLAGNVTYLVDDGVYAESSGASVNQFSLPESPKKDGYSFNGWYMDEKFEKPFELNKIGFIGLYFGKTTVYAKFDKHVHSFETRETTKPTCTQTGVKIKVCKDLECNYIQSTEVVPAKGHNASAMSINPHFNDDGSIRRFSFDGKCSDCNTDISLRNVTADVKSEEVSKANCQKSGEIRYTYKAYGKTFTYKHTIEQKEHSLNGKPISTYYVDDKYIAYGTKNIILNQTVSTKPECETTFTGKYICEDCNKYFDILVMQPHDDDITVVEGNEPNCENVGTAIHKCKVCHSERNVELPALGHVRFFHLTKNSDGSFTINCNCAREDCEFIFEEDTEKADLQFINSALISTSTCGANGRVLHTYNDGDLDISFIELLDCLPHTLNGVSADKFTYNDNGSFKFGTPGLKLFAGKKAIKCGEVEVTGTYYYVCEKCERPVPVTVDRRHDYVSYVNLKPTCEADGIREYSCSTCNYSYTEPITKLEHIAEFKNGERTPVYQKNDDGYIIYTFQDSIALPESYVDPRNNDIVKGIYYCDSCKNFIETEVIVRLAK